MEPIQPDPDAGERPAGNTGVNAPVRLVIEDLLCPITLALPLDPVKAEDGKMYDRRAIETHIERNGASGLRSPITNLPMGSRLLPCPEIENIIENAIDNGIIAGDYAAEWLEQQQNGADAEYNQEPRFNIPIVRARIGAGFLGLTVVQCLLEQYQTPVGTRTAVVNCINTSGLLPVVEAGGAALRNEYQAFERAGLLSDYSAALSGPRQYGTLAVPFVIHVSPASYQNFGMNDANEASYIDACNAESIFSCLDCANEARLWTVVFPLLPSSGSRGNMEVRHLVRLFIWALEEWCASQQGIRSITEIVLCSHDDAELSALCREVIPRRMDELQRERQRLETLLVGAQQRVSLRRNQASTPRAVEDAQGSVRFDGINWKEDTIIRIQSRIHQQYGWDGSRGLFRETSLQKLRELLTVMQVKGFADNPFNRRKDLRVFRYASDNPDLEEMKHRIQHILYNRY